MYVCGVRCAHVPAAVQTGNVGRFSKTKIAAIEALEEKNLITDVASRVGCFSYPRLLRINFNESGPVYYLI